jgi:hypothetical protein
MPSQKEAVIGSLADSSDCSSTLSPLNFLMTFNPDAFSSNFIRLTEASEVPYFDVSVWFVISVVCELSLIAFSASNLYQFIKESNAILRKEKEKLIERRKEFDLYQALIFTNTLCHFLLNGFNFWYLKGLELVLNPLFLMQLDQRNMLTQCILPFFGFYNMHQLKTRLN